MGYGESLPPEIEAVGTVIVDASYQVHLRFGAGLLESVYEACLEYELRKRGLKVIRQVRVPIRYDEVVLDEGFRVDLLVEDCIIIEVKAVDRIHPIHTQQVLTYLKLMKLQLGYVINFNVLTIGDGIKRVINTRI